MMSYEELVRDTAEMTNRMQLKWDVISAIMIILCAALVVIGIRLIWEEHRERKERKAQEVYAGYQYQPVVTDTVRVENGVEYHRMGPAGRVAD